jgi:large subunit ribosomal protein L29
MPRLKAPELRNLTPDELKEKRDGLKKELFSLRLQAKLGKLEKHATIQLTKRDLARIETVLREKEQS